MISLDLARLARAYVAAADAEHRANLERIEAGQAERVTALVAIRIGREQ